ncbi:MAG: enoyl-CoA hydratase/isomerase family protein [Smithellaceae bacterium]
MAELLSVKKERGVALITLENQKKLNAMSTALVRELREALEDIENDESVGVTVITSVGRAFCAGFNLEEIASKKRGIDIYPVVRNVHKLFLEMQDKGKPIIAAVNGMALGGGLEMTMACDIRIAAESAIFGVPEIHWGLLPVAGGMTRLPRLVGVGLAMELVLTGRNVKSDEALRIGLVNRVVPDDKLMEETMKMAEMIASAPAISIATGKATIYLNLDTNTYSATINESKAICKLLDTEDAQEGLHSFLEKRPHVPYKGR